MRDAQRLRIDVQLSDDRWTVFLRMGSRRRRVGTPVSMALVDEARRYGQDPIEDLVEQAMQLADRWMAPAGPLRR